MITPREAIHEDDGVIKIHPGINMNPLLPLRERGPLGVRRGRETPRFDTALLTGGWGQGSGAGGMLLSPLGMLGNGMGDTGQMDRFGSDLQDRGSGSSESEGLILDLGARVPVIMTVKRLLSDKGSRKFDPLLGLVPDICWL